MKTILAVAMAGLVLVACGDEDSGPTKAEYIEKADAVCTKVDPTVDAALARAARDRDNPEVAQTGLKDAIPRERQMLTELRELETPEGDEEAIDRIYAARQTAVDAAEAASSDPDASLAFITREGEGDKLFNEYLALAGEYGLVFCAQARSTLNGQP